MPKSAPPRREYRGPNYARDPRLRETMGGDGPLKVTDNRKVQMTPTQRRIIQNPEFPRGPMQGLDMPGKAWDPWDGPKIGGPTNRMIRGGKWGAGTAGVGLIGYGGHRTLNRKGKRMNQVRKNADIPFKGVRTFAAPKLGKHKDQLPFTEHFVNRNASPRQLTVTRATGPKSGGKAGRLVVVKKSALPTRVTSVQPRTPQGKFVGHANDLQVFHPKFKSSNRQPRTSKLQHYTRGKKDQYASGFEKSLFGGGDELTMAMSGSANFSSMAAAAGRKGVRFDKEPVSKWAGHQQGKTLAGTFGRGGSHGPGAKQAKVNLMPQKKNRKAGFSLKPRAPFRREAVNNSVFNPGAGNFVSAPNTSRWARNRPRHAA